MNVKLCSRVAAVLMIVMLGCQFLPYWNDGAGQSASVNSYVWFPHDNEWVTGQLKAAEEGYSINSVAYPTVLILLLSAIGAVVCLWKSDSMLACLFPTVCGGYGLAAYLTTAALKAGGLWWLHVLVLAGVLVAGVAGFVCGFRGRIE